MMPRVGSDHKRAPPDTQQVILMHHPQHALMVDVKTAMLQLGGDSPVAIGRKFQGDPLHFIADLHFHRQGLAR